MMLLCSRKSTIELSILVSDFMVNYMLKNTQSQRYFVECMKCLKEDAQKKEEKRTDPAHRRVGMIKSLPVPNYLILCTSLMDSVVI